MCIFAETIMKKYLFGFTMVLAVVFTSCTKDEPADNSTTTSPIVAKWEVTDMNIRLQDSMTGGQLFDTAVIESYAAGEMVIDFRSNGDVITSYENGSEADTMYYTFTAPVLKMYEDKTMTGEFEEYNVTFSGNNAAIKAKDFYETFDAGGFPITMKTSMTINAKKL